MEGIRFRKRGKDGDAYMQKKVCLNRREGTYSTLRLRVIPGSFGQFRSVLVLLRHGWCALGVVKEGNNFSPPSTVWVWIVVVWMDYRN